MYDVARQILGADFISPEEIAKARGLAYTEDQLTLLRSKLPDQAIIEALRDNGMMLVAGPPTAMNMLDVTNQYPDYFYRKGPDRGDAGWYHKASEQFARNDTVDALCWLALTKRPLKQSIRRNWTDQKKLVARPLYVPNVAEISWGATVYRAVTGECLLGGIGVRTSSINLSGYRVCVNLFVENEFDIQDCRDDRRLADIGLLACRKF